MKHNIAAFEVLDHGEDGSQYFPGCGVANTPFEHVATGVGDTGAEAFADALEQMANDDARPTDAQVAEMRTYIADLSGSARDSLDHSECGEDHDGDDWNHYVSIRYTLAKSDISGLSGARVNPWGAPYHNRPEDDWNLGGTFSYGHMDRVKDGAWIVPDYTLGSDYSGTLVERSNFNVIRDAAEKSTVEGAPAFYVELCGGHGTFALAFHLERTPEDIRKQLLDLEDYPLADEDEHSHLEIEAQSAAWDNYGASDYRRAIEREYDGDADAVTDDALFEHFREAMDKSNTDWENEQGDSMYVDLDRVIERGAREMDPPPGFIPNESEDA